jgi:hypothetical protein
MTSPKIILSVSKYRGKLLQKAFCVFFILWMVSTQYKCIFVDQLVFSSPLLGWVNYILLEMRSSVLHYSSAVVLHSQRFEVGTVPNNSLVNASELGGRPRKSYRLPRMSS